MCIYIYLHLCIYIYICVCVLILILGHCPTKRWIDVNSQGHSWVPVLNTWCFWWWMALWWLKPYGSLAARCSIENSWHSQPNVNAYKIPRNIAMGNPPLDSDVSQGTLFIILYPYKMGTCPLPCLTWGSYMEWFCAGLCGRSLSSSPAPHIKATCR